MRDRQLRLVSGPYVFLAKTDREKSASGMLLVAPDGLVIRDSANFVLTDMIIIGSVTVENSPGACLRNVKILSPDGVALTVDAASTGVTLTDCRVEGKTAIENSGDRLLLLSSYIGFSEKGLMDDAAFGLFVRDCRFVGTAGTAIATAGTGVELRQNTVETATDATAIKVGEAENLLMAANVVKKAQQSVVITGADNLSLVRNSAVSITVQNARHAYVIDNALGGLLGLADNDYLIADGNSFSGGDKLLYVDAIGNQNTNGDNIADVDARLSVGADEKLLPHVDKLQFVGATLAEKVFDPAGEEELDIYVETHAASDGYVYIAPGAYKAWSTWNFKAEQKGATVYAYGMYAERPMPAYGQHILVENTADVSIKGGSFAYERPQCAQGYVIEKIPGTTNVVIVTAAGMLNEFGSTGSGEILFETSGGMMFRKGTSYPYVEIGDRSEVKNANGTITVTLKQAVYNMVKVGDVMACHNELGTPAHGGVEHGENILFKDMTVYGNTGAACFGENYSSVTYYRVADVPDAGRPITKAEYDRYKDIEERYGITTDVWTDGTNYYGAPSRFSSKDATHVAFALRGSQAISCRFESMIDDATNQRSAHARLSSLTDNGNGTYTVVYKANLYKVAYDRDHRTPSGWCTHFEAGNRVFIYTTDGKLLVDGPALSDAVKGASLTTEYDTITDTYSVIVAADAVHTENLSPALLLDTPGATTSSCNGPVELKALVDNRSYASDGFLFDNVYASNIRSRAMLIKSSGGTIKNCTFENIAQAVIAIYYEVQWGESGVSDHVTIANNRLINVGYLDSRQNPRPNYAPISVESLGYHDFSLPALYNHIVITGNVIESRGSYWAVSVVGASDVTVTGNDFGSRYRLPTGVKPTNTVYLDTVNRITIADNIFPKTGMTDAEKKASYSFVNVKGLSGGDVVGMFPDFE